MQGRKKRKKSQKYEKISLRNLNLFVYCNLGRHRLYPAKTIKKDCWDVAVERCLPCIQAGYECEIWLGRLPITPFHAESCIVVAGKRIWLRGGGAYRIVIDHNYMPRFEPIYRFSFRQFMNAMYMVK